MMKGSYYEKKFLFLVTVAFLVTISSGNIYATPAALDWTWTFTKAYDYDGNVLGEMTGTSNENLVFSVPNTMYSIYIYGTINANQDLTLANIDFAGAGSNFGGLGEGVTGYFKSYDLSLFQPSQLDDELPIISTNTPLSFWYWTAYLKPPSYPPALPGDYTVYDSGINFYDLTENIFDEWGYRPLHSVYATNDVIWTVRSVPEPATMLLLGLGLLGIAGVRRKFEK